MSNQLDTHCLGKLSIQNQPMSINPTYPPLMNTSILKTPPETLLNCISLIGYIWIDMSWDSTATLRKVSWKAISKTKETEKSRYCFTSKTTPYRWTNKKSKTMDSLLARLSSEEKNVSDKTENSWQLMTSDWAMLSQSTVGTFICMTVMVIHESSSKSLDNRKALQNCTKTTNGLRRSTASGFPEKMEWWKNTLRRN